ncbi:MAG: hypothetical protein ACI30I_04310 [Parabacteroides sp.]
MKNISTFCMQNAGCTSKAEQKMGSPRKQTLDFLMQFARAYRVENAIDPKIGGYMLN